MAEGGCGVCAAASPSGTSVLGRGEDEGVCVSRVLARPRQCTYLGSPYLLHAL